MAVHEHSNLAVRRHHNSKAGHSTRYTNMVAGTAAESAFLEGELGIVIAAGRLVELLLQWCCYRLLEQEYPPLLLLPQDSL